MIQQTKTVRKYIVYVEGNIGVGKSTLLKKLSADGYQVLPEPVELWTNFEGINFLNIYSNDMEKWAFTFQVLALFTLWKSHIESISEDNRVIIAERSVHSVVQMFAVTQVDNKFMSPEQFILLNKMSKFLASLLHREQLFIYLQASPAEVFTRVQSRARDEESALSKDYLTDLHEVLDKWMHSEPDLHAVIDSSKTPDAVYQQVSQALKQLK